MRSHYLNRKSPRAMAKRLGLEYIGSSTFKNETLYYFNTDSHTTLAVKDVSKLKAARDKSRLKFKGEL